MKDRDYSHFYQQLTGRIRESGAACFLLRTAGKAATGIMYAAYPILLARLAVEGACRDLLFSVLIPGAGFVLLTLVRAKINRPRPYETWDIRPLIHSRKDIIFKYTAKKLLTILIKRSIVIMSMSIKNKSHNCLRCRNFTI